MLRGEFIRGDGLVVPNNITTHGAYVILHAALRNTVPTFWVGLVDGVPEPDLQIEDLIEPTIGTHGYARQSIARSAGGWPVEGVVNGLEFLESTTLTFTATGGNFDKSIRRLMLTDQQNATSGALIALSAPLPAGLVITPDTPDSSRQFKYRVYLR